jgi:hypothetical protein
MVVRTRLGSVASSSWPLRSDSGAFARMVEVQQVRFVMLGDLSFISRRMGAEGNGRPVAEWVYANGKLVDPALWRSSVRTRMALYDLRPGLGLASAVD